jgi:hypothetical protein
MEAFGTLILQDSLSTSTVVQKQVKNIIESLH